MSNTRRSSTTSITDDQITQLISNLHQLLPPSLRNNRHRSHVSASRVLQETCNYIRNLHQEVDDLSERLSQYLLTIDDNSPEAAIIRSLIL